MADKVVNLKVKVTAKSGLVYRSSPGGTRKGAYPYNKQLTVDRESSNGWYRVKSANVWISKSYTSIVSKSTPKPVSKSKAEAAPAKKKSAAVKQNTLSTPSIYAAYDNSIYEKAMVKNLNGIHGLPYQFMDSVDARIVKVDNRSKNSGDTKRKELGFGRKYNEKIISKMPLLLMTPGTPDFLPSFKTNEKSAILSSLATSIGKINKGTKLYTELSSIMNGKGGRFYTFKFNYYDYYRFVNPMLQMCAKYLGIENVKHGNGLKKGYSAKLGSFNWAYCVNEDFKGFVSAREFVAFYVDAESSVNESFSTSTTQSSFASAVNGASDMARELQFLLGPIAGKRVQALDKSNYDATMNDINNIVNNHLNGSKLFKNLAEAFSTVAKGGKMCFPEIWEDTDFSKSYDVSLKLRTPDGDKLSWYLNILVPLIHILALAAPQQMGPNGYSSPFLVRAFYKGLFNCDMGIITSLNITKGREGAWTIDGLPTEVDVSMTLKDLYSLLFISNDNSVGNFMNNTCLMDYLANSCGININKPEVQRTIESYLMLKTNKIKNIPNNIWTHAENQVSNVAQNLYNKISFKN